MYESVVPYKVIILVRAIDQHNNPGENSTMKGSEKLTVSLRGIYEGFWSP